MSKRKLTRRQSWRVKKIQEERLERQQRKQEKAESELKNHNLGTPETGLVLIRYGVRCDIEDQAGQTIQCLMRQNLDVTCGDRVIWQRDQQAEGGVITAIEPRDTLLARPLFSGEVKPLAANISQLIIVIAPIPKPTYELIDRYIVAAELLNMQPVIVFNKTELESVEKTDFAQLDQLYKSVGYTTIYASAYESRGLTELQQVLAGETSIFVGQSGVGKSSLINLVLPDANIAVGEVSKATSHGKHTTSTARLYHIPTGGDLIDSPGVRSFKLWQSNPTEILQGFREFAQFIGKCQFRNCQHVNESGCALLQAIEADEIQSRRLQSYHNIINEL